MALTDLGRSVLQWGLSRVFRQARRLVALKCEMLWTPGLPAMRLQDMTHFCFKIEYNLNSLVPKDALWHEYTGCFSSVPVACELFEINGCSENTINCFPL